MINIDINNKIKVYNDGVLIIEGETMDKVKEIVEALLTGNSDDWEVELLNNILYIINNNLSTMEVHKIRIALYVRVSTEEQESSIVNLKEYIK